MAKITRYGSRKYDRMNEQLASLNKIGWRIKVSKRTRDGVWYPLVTYRFDRRDCDAYLEDVLHSFGGGIYQFKVITEKGTFYWTTQVRIASQPGDEGGRYIEWVRI